MCYKFLYGSTDMAKPTDNLTALELANRAAQHRPSPPHVPINDGSTETAQRGVSRPIRSAEQLGAVVMTRRKERKLTQQQFADLAGVGRRFVSELEGGKPTAEIGKTLQVLQALGIDLTIRDR